MQGKLPREIGYARGLIWFVVSIFYAYQYILRVLPSILIEDIIQNFKINSTIFGQFSGIYYLGYVLVHIPLGIMLDKYGPRKVMSVCIMISALSLIPIIFASHWIYLIISRALLGVGSSAAILGIFKIIRMNFNEKYFTRMLSLAVTIGLIGAIYGGGPISYLCERFGYKLILKILILTGLGLAVLTYYIIPDRKEVSESSNVLYDLKKAITNYKVIFLSFCAGLMVGPLEGFADVWGAKYLRQIYNLSHTESGYAASMIFIGMCFGSPILSYIGEKTGKYLPTIIGAGLIQALIFFLLIAGLLPVNALIICFIIVGVCSSYQVIAIYLASTFANPKLIGITTAITNMIIMGFGYGFHSVIGFTINRYQDVSLEQSLIYGIAIIPIALLLGCVGLILLRVQLKSVTREKVA